MLEKLKYPGLVLTFAIGNAVGLGTKLGILNLPLGLGVAGIGFLAAVVGGIIHAPKTTPAQAPALPPNVTPLPKKSPLKSVVNGAGQWVRFFLDTVNTPEYVVGASAAHGGYNLLFQAAMGIGVCVSAAWIAPALVPVAIAGCVVLGGVAVYSIVGGIDEQFKGVGKFFHNRLNKGAPIDPSKRNLIQKFVASPSVQNLIKQPLVQKFLNNRVVKAARKGPSPRVKKILLTCMAVETAVFSLVAAITVLTGSPAIIPLVIAANWAASSGWTLVQAARNSGLLKYVPGHDLIKNAMGRITGKIKALVPTSAPVVQFSQAPVPVAATVSLFTKVTKSLTSMFKKNADKKDAARNVSPKIFGAAKLKPVQP